MISVFQYWHWSEIERVLASVGTDATIAACAIAAPKY
jgi:hypothetical protein